MKKLYVYQILPIDWWTGWVLPEDILSDKDVQKDADFTRPAKVNRAEYQAMLNRAHELAYGLGWPGDVRDGPYIAALPDPEYEFEPPIMIGWKEDNNGTTYIASPIPLPHLEGQGTEMAVEG